MRRGCLKKWLVHHRENIVCDVEGGQNLLMCLTLIRGDEGVGIDIRKVCR
jgi:hypothetical protein